MLRPKSNEESIYLTELEIDVCINGIIKNSQFPLNPWSWAIADDCIIAKKDQISGIVSSLVKKGILHAQGEGNESFVKLTEVGEKVFKEMGAV